MGVWKIGQNDIHFPLFQQIDTFDGACVGNLNRNIGKTFMKALQVRQQKIAADGIACTDMKLPQHAGVQKLALAAGKQVDGRFHMLKQKRARLGELYFFGAPDKKSLVEPLFQGFDRLADGRLGDKKLFTGLGKGKRTCNIVKNLV